MPMVYSHPLSMYYLPENDDILVVKEDSPPVFYKSYVLEKGSVFNNIDKFDRKSQIKPCIDEYYSRSKKPNKVKRDKNDDFYDEPVLKKTKKGGTKIQNIACADILGDRFYLNVCEHYSNSGWNFYVGEALVSALGGDVYAVYSDNYGLMRSYVDNGGDYTELPITVSTTAATSVSGNIVDDYVYSVVENESVQVKRYFDTPRNGSFFHMGYIVKNIGGSALYNVKLFNMLDMDNGFPENEYAYYNPAEDSFIYANPTYVPQFKILIYPNVQSSRHGLGNSTWEISEDFLDYELNNLNEYNIVDPLGKQEDPAIGYQHNIGTLQPGDEKEIIFTIMWGNVTNRILPDLTPKNLIFKKQESNVNISFDIFNLGNTSARNFKISFYEVKDNEIIDEKIILYNDSLTGLDNVTLSTLMPLQKESEVFVYVDPLYLIPESEEGNNMIQDKYYSANVYLDINVSPEILNELFYDYVSDKLTHYNIVEDISFADYVIHAGYNAYNNYTLNDLDWGIEDGSVKLYDNKDSMPYNALINNFEDSKLNVFVLGNDIEGIVAALRKFDYDVLEKNKDVFISRTNMDALSIFDYFQSPVNKPYYMVNNETFRDIVRLGLMGGYDFEEEFVKTHDLVTLRLKHIAPKHTLTFNEYLDVLYDGKVDFNFTKTPVVMSGGLWNNLSYWEDLGGELAASGRDVWLIEITGGPDIECDECYDYTFDDLTDNYWPALIAGVQAYTGEDKIQYVGFSNGARTALSSLDKWNDVGIANISMYWNGTHWLNTSMTANPIETLVAVGAPGAFEGGSPAKSALNLVGGRVISNSESKGVMHILFEDLLKMGYGHNYFSNDAMISLNLFKQYYNFSKYSDDNQPAVNLTLNKFAAIRGWVTDDNYGSDWVVTKDDVDNIYSNVNSTNKTYFKVFGPHSDMGFSSFAQKEETRDIIMRKLNGDEYNAHQRCYNLIDPEDKPWWCTW